MPVLRMRRCLPVFENKKKMYACFENKMTLEDDCFEKTIEDACFEK